jgi:hypothetical protein
LYVVFELGARWGTEKTFIPLLAPGTPSSVLGGPLAGINALRLDSEAQIHQLLGDLGRFLGRSVENPSVYKRDLDAFLQRASANQEEVIEAGLRAEVRNEAGATSVAFIRETEDEITIPVGLISHYFATEPDGDTCALSSCRVLVCAAPMSGMMELLPILEQAARDEQPLLIVTRSVTGEALSTLILNTQRGTVRACVVCTEGSADPRRLERLVAKRTSAKIFGDEAAIPLESASLSQLGQAARVEAGVGYTTIRLGSA